MKLNRKKGKWYDVKEFGDWFSPTIIDDIAYHLYCKDKEHCSCTPQITMMYNYYKYNHKIFKTFYKEADKIIRRLKINQIKTKINPKHENIR